MESRIYGDYTLHGSEQLIIKTWFTKAVCNKCSYTRLIARGNIARGNCTKCPMCEYSIHDGFIHGDFKVIGGARSGPRGKKYFMQCMKCEHKKELQQALIKQGKYLDCSKCNEEHLNKIKMARSQNKTVPKECPLDPWWELFKEKVEQAQQLKKLRRG